MSRPPRPAALSSAAGGKSCAEAHRVPRTGASCFSNGRTRLPCLHTACPMSGMRFPQRAGCAPLAPLPAHNTATFCTKIAVFLCRMMQKNPKRLAVVLNSPYLCSTHLQIEGVSGLDRLDAASSPAFFGSRASRHASAQSAPPHFSHKRGHLAAKAPAFQSKSPILSPPFAPCRQKGAKFCRFVSRAALAHGLQISGRTARRSSPTGRPPTAQGFAPERHTERRTTTHSFSKQQKNKTYNYGKDYRN